jgi:hypothetical protein
MKVSSPLLEQTKLDRSEQWLQQPIASWQERVDVLTKHDYKRYDESNSILLGETARTLLNRYQGDLRLLRDEADRNVNGIHKSLHQLKALAKLAVVFFYARSS